MKILQDHIEESWQFTSFAKMDGLIRRVENPKEIILLLHGLGERGKRIYRKLISNLPKDAVVLAPNGPFPIPRHKEERLDFGHSWYFYDALEKKYFINQDLAKFWLRDLVRLENPLKLPVTIIGFSQGGYLSPLVAKEIPETKLVIGLSCEFRTVLMKTPLHFNVVGIHGDQDKIIPIEGALREVSLLKGMDIDVKFHIIKNLGHEINQEMGLVVQNVLENYGKRSL